MIGRDVDERTGRGVAHRGAIDVEDGLQREGDQVGAGDSTDRDDEDARPAQQDCHQHGDRDPDEPERSDPRQADEDPVEPTDPVEDDEALEMSVERDHAEP